jgi:hypothetical protein
MSYDFAGRIDTGGPEPHYVEPYFTDTHPAFNTDGAAGTVMVTAQGYARCGNYTSNVSAMWSKCLTAALVQLPDSPLWDWAEKDASLRLGALADLPCRDLVDVLRLAVEWGVEHIDELREDNPENGWGNAEGAVTYLWDIQRFCEANPNCDLYISR